MNKARDQEHIRYIYIVYNKIVGCPYQKVISVISLVRNIDDAIKIITFSKQV